MTKTIYRHKAIVIESYPDIGQAAVEFYCNIMRRKRIEIVRINAQVGDTGIVDFISTASHGMWVFNKT